MCVCRLTWRQTATFTRQPNVVLTARVDSPRSLKIVEKDCVRELRGRSSATTIHVLTHARLTFLNCTHHMNKLKPQSKHPHACTRRCQVFCDWPAGLPSVSPGPWCTSPWQNMSRRSLALYTDWRRTARETRYSPTPEEEPEWTDGPSTRCKQRRTSHHRSTHHPHVTWRWHSPAEAPESQTQPAVGIQTDGDLTRGIQLTLQFNGATQGTGGCMRHLWQTHGTVNMTSPTAGRVWARLSVTFTPARIPVVDTLKSR